MFRVGQKVVRVDDAVIHKDGLIARRYDGRVVKIGSDLSGLHKGTIYTIDAIDLPYYPSVSAAACLVLKEINRGHPVVRGFCSTRFRPIVEKSTDTGMAVLREILDRESFDEKTPEHHKA